MSKIPKTWQEKPHYEPGVLWFTRDSRPRNILGQQIMSEPSQDYPGWFFYFRADQRMLHGNIQEAISELKGILKHWRMESRWGDETVPLQPSKEERKQMVVQLLEYPIPDPIPPYERENGQEQPELIHLQWEFGEYMLVISLWYSPFPEEFSTTFASDDNPVRSLIGQIATLKGTTLADLDREIDDDGFEAEWKTISVGTVNLEGNRLTVGFWSHELEPDSRVIGVAYSEASFEGQTMSYFLLKGAEK